MEVVITPHDDWFDNNLPPRPEEEIADDLLASDAVAGSTKPLCCLGNEEARVAKRLDIKMPCFPKTPRMPRCSCPERMIF